MKRWCLLWMLAGLCRSETLFAQAAPQPEGSPKVDQSKIDAAIKKGIEYLKSRNSQHLDRFVQSDTNKMQHTELVLWTYVHAGVPETDPAFKELFQDMMKRPLEATYCVSLQAMILEELDRVKYQARIKRCAQFLVDNQCTNGQWTYGEPTIFAEDKDTATETGTPSKKGGVLKFDDPGVRVKPAVTRRVKVEQKKTGPEAGDNSNTQYAALGMRACYDAGIIIPPGVVDKAMTWYRTSQAASEGPALELNLKDASVARKGQSAVKIVLKAEPRGWYYSDWEVKKPWGSMTAGSVGGLAIWDYIKDDDWDAKKAKKLSWRRDKDVHGGLAWLTKHFSVTDNPEAPESAQAYYFYYLYALERVGMLYGTESFGAHDWYAEGAKVLIEKQGADGSWGDYWAGDTCFAILFLRRATEPLVPSVDRFANPKVPGNP